MRALEQGDAAGRVRLGNVPRLERLTLVVMAGGFQPLVLKGRAGQLRRRVEVQLGNTTRPAETGEGSTVSATLPSGEAATLVFRSPHSEELRLPVPGGSSGEKRDLGEVRLDRGRFVTGRVVRRGPRVLCSQHLEIASSERVVEATCSPRAVLVRGNVVLGEAPVSGGRLVFQSPSPAIPGGILRIESPHGLRQQVTVAGSTGGVEVEVDTSGAFATRDLWPGRFQVVCVLPDGGVLGPREVEIADLEEVRLRLAFAGASIRGVVEKADGGVAAGARGEELDAQRVALAREDGTFTLLGVSPGVHRLRARLGAEVSDAAAVRVDAEGEPPFVELTVDAALAVEVTVAVQSSRGRTGGSPVVIEDSTGRARLLVADQQGIARARFSPPLPERVRAAA